MMDSSRQLRLCASTTPHLKALSTTAASSVISRGLQHEMSPPSTTSHPSPPPPTASPSSSCSGNDASYKRWRTSTHSRVQRGNRSNSWRSLIPHSCFVLLAVLSALPSGKWTKINTYKFLQGFYLQVRIATTHNVRIIEKAALGE